MVRIFGRSRWLMLWVAIASVGLAIFLLIVSVAPSTRAETTVVPPVTARDFWRVGTQETQRGNYQLAIAHFTRAIALDSRLAAAYNNRCWVYLQLSAYANARHDCTLTLQQSPNNAEAYLNRGLAAYHQGDYEVAIADYEAAIQLHHGDPRPYYNRGLVEFDLGNYLSAITEFNRALAQTSPAERETLASIYRERGLTQAQLGNGEGAIADFSRSLRLNPHNAFAYYNRALTHQHQQRYRAAIADFTLALQYQPDLALAHINRGLARDRLGQHQAAIEDLKRGANCLCQQGQLTAAERVRTLILQLRQNFSTPVTV